MPHVETLYESDIHHLAKVHRGKVRDVYEIGLHDLLIVTSDRISAFDVVLPNAIPGKGAILNQLSIFWFEKTAHIVPNHLAALSVAAAISEHPSLQLLIPRSVVVKKLKPLPMEAIVRGYLAGSGWKDYQANGAICGHRLPAGMSQAARLPAPIFTPSTKAALGGHDENVSEADLSRIIDPALLARVRQLSLELYRYAATYAEARGIIIADTKFEFGLDDSGAIVLMDELFTPDSSRFWPLSAYRTGISPPSFDKQFVRDYLETLDWDKTEPGPKLPEEIVTKTAQRYNEAWQRLTASANSE